MAHSWDGSSIRMTDGCTSIAPTPKWNAWTIPPRFRERPSYVGSFWIRNASGSKRSAHADVPARAHAFAPRRCLPTRGIQRRQSFRSLAQRIEESMGSPTPLTPSRREGECRKWE